MKLRKVLPLLPIVVMLLSIFTITGSAYAYALSNKSIKDGPESNETKTGIEEDAGSPMHLWNALSKNFEAGQRITKQDIYDIRKDWSKTTINEEINSLLDYTEARGAGLGILEAYDDGYIFTKKATPDQIDDIAEQAKPIVKGVKRVTNKTILGHRLDADQIGSDRVTEIKNIIDDVLATPETVSMAEAAPAIDVTGLGPLAQDGPQPAAVTKPILKKRFNEFSNTRVITITEAGLISLPASERQKIYDKVTKEKYALAIATDNEGLFEEGKAEALIKQKLPGLEDSINTKVFFSLIKNAKTWNDLEKAIQKGVELGALNEAQALAIRNALKKG